MKERASFGEETELGQRTMEKFESFSRNRPNSNVRQMPGRKGETWIAESGTERNRVIRYPTKIN